MFNTCTHIVEVSSSKFEGACGRKIKIGEWRRWKEGSDETEESKKEEEGMRRRGRQDRSLSDGIFMSSLTP